MAPQAGSLAPQAVPLAPQVGSLAAQDRALAAQDRARAWPRGGGHDETAAGTRRVGAEPHGGGDDEAAAGTRRVGAEALARGKKAPRTSATGAAARRTAPDGSLPCGASASEGHSGAQTAVHIGNPTQTNGSSQSLLQLAAKAGEPRAGVVPPFRNSDIEEHQSPLRSDPTPPVTGMPRVVVGRNLNRAHFPIMMAPVMAPPVVMAPRVVMAPSLHFPIVVAPVMPP